MSISKELYRLLFEISPGVVLVLCNNEIIACNAGAAGLLGCPAETIRSCSLLDLSAEYQGDNIASKSAWESKIEAVRRGTSQIFEWRFKRLNGENFDAQVMLNALDHDGQIYLQLTIIAGRKQAGILSEELSALPQLMTGEQRQAYAYRVKGARGYLFNQTEIQPLINDDENGGQHPEVGNGPSFAKPMTVSGEEIGQIGVYDNQPLEPEDQEFLNLIAEQVAEALERTRLLEQTHQRAVELEAVAQVSMAASTALDVNELLQQVVDLTKARFNLYHAHIYLFDDPLPTPFKGGREGGVLVLAAGAGEAGRKMVVQGWSIPFDREDSLVARVARMQQGIIVNDVRQETYFLANPLLPDTRSELAVPLIAGPRLLGVLDVQADVVGRFTQADLQIQTTLASQVAVVLRNASLYAETQAALAETEALYDISAHISTALTLDEVLLAATTPAIDNGAANAQLFSIELDQDGQPAWLEVAATWPDDDTTVSPGTRFYLPDFPFAKLWVSDPHNLVLIGHVAEDKRLDPATRTIFEQSGIAASILMPLLLAGRWVGLISINWKTPYPFAESDRRLYKSVAIQAGVVVNNFLLLEETRQRAVQLERLAQLESALSKADKETEILDTVAQVLESDQDITIVLYYMDLNLDGQPTRLNPIARWQDTSSPLQDITPNKPVRLDSIPGVSLWLDNPNKMLLFDDVSVDTRLDEASQQMATELGFKGMAILPLYSGGRWQGVITFSWAETYNLTNNEQFMLQQLLEPIAAVVAGRRAYVAQQQTLDETASLYVAGRHISAANNLQEVVAALMEELPIPVINRAVLYIFEHNAAGEMESMVLRASWYKGVGTLPLPIGTRYPRAMFISTGLLLNPEPLFFDDIQHDERIDDPATLAVLQQQNIRAMAVLPLWIGTRQLGVLLLEAEEIYHFTESEIRPYLSLIGPVAVSVENHRLLEQAQARVRHEQILREVTAQVHLATDVDTIMRTAAQEVGRALGRQAFVYLAPGDGAAEDVAE